MLVYWVVWGWIALLTFLENRTSIYKFLYFLTLFFIAIFVGLRYEVGVDWKVYLIIYHKLKDYSLAESIIYTDPLYGALNYLGNKLGFQDIIFVNLSCSIVLFYFFYKFSNKFQHVWLPLLVSYTYFIVVVSMNYVRQSVAISISLLALYFALNNKKYYFLVLVLLASLFHSSALMLLVFFPIFYLINNQFSRILNLFYVIFSLSILTFLLYYSSLYGSNIYTDSNNQISSSGALFRVLYHFIPVVLYIYNRDKFINLLGSRVVFLDYMIILIFYCFFLTLFYSTLADRFNLYLCFFDIFIYSYLYQSFNLNKKMWLLSIIFLFSSLTFFIWFNFGTFAGKGWIPYQNYFFNFLAELV